MSKMITKTTLITKGGDSLTYSGEFHSVPVRCRSKKGWDFYPDGRYGYYFGQLKLGEGQYWSLVVWDEPAEDEDDDEPSLYKSAGLELEVSPNNWRSPI